MSPIRHSTSDRFSHRRLRRFGRSIVFVDLAPRPVLASLGLALVLLTAGCADTRGGTIPYDRPLAAPDEQKFQTLPEDYRIAPMDTVTIKLFGEHSSDVTQATSSSI